MIYYTKGRHEVQCAEREPRAAGCRRPRSREDRLQRVIQYGWTIDDCGPSATSHDRYEKLNRLSSLEKTGAKGYPTSYNTKPFQWKKMKFDNYKQDWKWYKESFWRKHGISWGNIPHVPEAYYFDVYYNY